MAKRGSYRGGSIVFGPGSSWFGRSESDPVAEDINPRKIKVELSPLNNPRISELEKKKPSPGKKKGNQNRYTLHEVRDLGEKELKSARQKAEKEWSRIFRPRGSIDGNKQGK